MSNGGSRSIGRYYDFTNDTQKHGMKRRYEHTSTLPTSCISHVFGLDSYVSQSSECYIFTPVLQGAVTA
jgi:hypothetical protein